MTKDGNTANARVPATGPYAKKLNQLLFTKSTGQLLFMAIFAVRDAVSRVLTMKNKSITDDKWIQSHLQCEFQAEAALEYKAAAKALLLEIKAGKHDKALGEEVGVTVLPEDPLSSKLFEGYIAARLKPWIGVFT
jgi:hypothetical protein